VGVMGWAPLYLMIYNFCTSQYLNSRLMGNMFGKFREMLAASVNSGLEGDVLEAFLGKTYASDYKNLLKNNHDDENDKKRALGLKYIAKSILETKREFSDDKRHSYFWSQVVKPNISQRFGLSLTGEYDSARFYIDAIDFRLSIKLLMSAVAGENSYMPDAMIETITALNLRELESGGYFGNTPYWTMHDDQNWGKIDRDFISIQCFWLALLLADETSASTTSKLLKAAQEKNIFENIPDSSSLYARLMGRETSRVMQLAAVGALHFSAIKLAGSRRPDGLAQIAVGVIPNAYEYFEALMVGRSIHSVAAMQAIVPSGHIMSILPNNNFIFSMSFQMILMEFSSLSNVTTSMLEMPLNEEIIANANEVAPHLFAASTPQ
jgi:hypothetical protein